MTEKSNSEQSEASAALRMVVVYRNPRDYPGMFVARVWTIGSGRFEADTEPLWVDCDLGRVRERVDDFFGGTKPHRLDPDPTDDRAIYEVWI